MLLLYNDNSKPLSRILIMGNIYRLKNAYEYIIILVCVCLSLQKGPNQYATSTAHKYPPYL